MNTLMKRPVITEKASAAVGDNQYVFMVDPSANKIEIKKWVEAYFKVDVVSVNTLNVKGKLRRRGKFIGKTRDQKKAIVKIKEGQTLDKIKGLF